MNLFTRVRNEADCIKPRPNFGTSLAGSALRVQVLCYNSAGIIWHHLQGRCLGGFRLITRTMSNLARSRLA
jgi:hypothetical protein